MASMIRRQSDAPFFKSPRTFAPTSPNGFPIGKRTVRRAKENAELRKLEIKSCELRLKGCTGRNYLTWAHSKKSRFLVTSADWQEAARACLNCHQIIEAKSHAEMKKAVQEAVRQRSFRLPGAV